MHEQGGGYAAEGYAKISKNLGVAIATSGPGGMNLITSMGNCFYDSVPCLFITGQIKLKYMRPDPSIRQIGFQESDMVSLTSPVTKYSKLIEDPESIRYELEKAIYLAKQLTAYKTKSLENEVMQSVAGILSTEEIASLALYFSELSEDKE